MVKYGLACAGVVLKGLKMHRCYVSGKRALIIRLFNESEHVIESNDFDTINWRFHSNRLTWCISYTVATPKWVTTGDEYLWLCWVLSKTLVYYFSDKINAIYSEKCLEWMVSSIWFVST
jgi:hypothetical protein